MRRRAITPGGALLLVSAALWVACAEPTAAPNVVLISVDTLRADRMSLYGYEKKTTPNLEALAHDSVVFDAFFNAGGGTLKSHASLFTSLYPEVHEVTPRRALDERFLTLAEVLRPHGYATAAFTDIVWLRRKYGFAQGFDLYDQEGGNLQRILPATTRWLADGVPEPFFLFLHTFDVHSSNRRLPYDSPEDFNEVFTRGYQGTFDGCLGGRCASDLLGHINRLIARDQIELGDVLDRGDLDFISGLYDGGVFYVDREIGKLVETLKETGLYDRTLLVVLSDHGEELGEHGRMLHGNPYEEFVRIPLLIKLPGSRHAGKRLVGLASMVDVMPTLLEALRIPPAQALQGRSLMPLIETGRAARSHVISYEGSVRSARWKLIAARDELYDLERDPAERRNVFDARSDVVAALSAEREKALHDIATTRRALGASRGSAPHAAELSPTEREQLRGLGYLD